MDYFVQLKVRELISKNKKRFVKNNDITNESVVDFYNLILKNCKISANEDVKNEIINMIYNSI